MSIKKKLAMAWILFWLLMIVILWLTMIIRAMLEYPTVALFFVMSAVFLGVTYWAGKTLGNHKR
jgi:hypothetical protein